MDQEKATLIVDEAHNLGDAVRAMNSRVLTMRMIDFSMRRWRSSRELWVRRDWRRRVKALPGDEKHRIIRMVLPRLKKFLEIKQERMQEGEALLDADLFRSYLYDGVEDIDEALSYFSDVAVAVADLNLAEGDRENLQGDIQPSLSLVLLFLRDVENAEKDPSYQRKIAVSGSGGRKSIRLEVNNIDPAANIRRVTDNINATIMLSGTFSPLEAYELYCLARRIGQKKLMLPIPFQKRTDCF